MSEQKIFDEHGYKGAEKHWFGMHLRASHMQGLNAKEFGIYPQGNETLKCLCYLIFA